MLEENNTVSVQPYNERSRLYLYSDDVVPFITICRLKAMPRNIEAYQLYHTHEFDLHDPEGYRLTIGQCQLKE